MREPIGMSREAAERSLPHKHVHKFVMPVEWLYEFHDGQIVVQNIPTHPEWLKVTKLRCSCGKEIER